MEKWKKRKENPRTRTGVEGYFLDSALLDIRKVTRVPVSLF